MHSFKRHYGIIVRMTLDPGMRLAIYMLKTNWPIWYCWILQLVADHSTKLFISETLAFLSEATHSVAVLSVREKNVNR